MTTLNQIQEKLLQREKNLSPYATKSEEAVRLEKEEEDIRPPFFHDIDRIIYSTAYARYLDKTQVFSFVENDHISKRALHVQLVSKIARTIGRCLDLNEDLIEAMALGHDIGHTPLGHVGERILNDISMRELNIPFMHNLQGVRSFLTIGSSNLTIQVLDGIMCHNGEIVSPIYAPCKKEKEEFLHDYEQSCQSVEYAKKLRPMTLEGCVVRISDVIAYIGRDIEDAIRLGRLDAALVPKEITSVLGTTNSEIVNTIILDIVQNSYGKNAIILSDEIYLAILRLKDFNNREIYQKANTKEEIEYYERGMNRLFTTLLEDLENKNQDSILYRSFLKDMKKEYLEKENPKKIVIDFIAGMTDDYFRSLLKTVN